MTARRRLAVLGSRLPLRARLVGIFSLVFAASTAAVLVVSYVLIRDHLETTLADGQAAPILRGLALQYVLALVGTTMLAAGLGWLAARRLLRPVAAVTDAARRASDEHLGERIALGGPHDELRELADTFDAMLDRFQGSIEAQRRFVANASHELRSPLTAIRTEVEVTMSDPAATVAELREMGDRVLEGSDELDQLLAALMVLARSQRGLVAGKPLDLAQAAVLAAQDAGRQASAARVTLDVDVAHAPGVESPLPVPISGDPALVRRLVANLVDNAIRYHRPGGTVLVQVRTEGGAAVLRVVNLGGARVRADEVERLRQPFERLERTTASGSGLGLSIVQAVAEAHAGTVELAAPAAGGLEVTVRLPERTTDRAAVAAAAPRSMAGRAPNV
ncbi:MAG: HAMP domain-containing sensor histidine kinase [Patulibacter minatonensis]